MTSSSNQRLLASLPTYWFLGLFQALDGSMTPALAPLARRAAVGLLLAIVGAALAFVLSYFRTIRKIAAEPDITAGAGGGRRLRVSAQRPSPPSPTSASARFSAAGSIACIFSFFLALGFANVILYVKTPIAQKHLLDAGAASSWRMVNVPLLAATAILLCFAVVGMRVAFAIPVDLRSHWIFRIANSSGVPECVNSTRRTLIFLGAAPVWLISAALLLWLWPVNAAVGHLLLLALLAAILIELCLYNFHKIPFTCSYLPGKANIYLIFFGGVFLLIPTLDWAAHPNGTHSKAGGATALPRSRCSSCSSRYAGEPLRSRTMASLKFASRNYSRRQSSNCVCAAMGSDQRAGRGRSATKSSKSVPTWLRAELPHHQRDLAAMRRGVIYPMLHQVRQTDGCLRQRERSFQVFVA